MLFDTIENTFNGVILSEAKNLTKTPECFR